jgi:hypothetical protein
VRRGYLAAAPSSKLPYVDARDAADTARRESTALPLPLGAAVLGLLHLRGRHSAPGQLQLRQQQVDATQLLSHAIRVLGTQHGYARCLLREQARIQ